jgi:hypothetical protein
MHPLGTLDTSFRLLVRQRRELKLLFTPLLSRRTRNTGLSRNITKSSKAHWLEPSSLMEEVRLDNYIQVTTMSSWREMARLSLVTKLRRESKTVGCIYQETSGRVETEAPLQTLSRGMIQLLMTSQACSASNALISLQGNPTEFTISIKIETSLSECKDTWTKDQGVKQ